MAMNLYNSISNKIEIFEPITSGKVLIYVCGITPYDTTHLGHAFTYTVFDALIRYLKFKGLEIAYVQNVTDIDDDILKRAKKENRDWQELGNFWTAKFLDDLKWLNILMPDKYVKATGSIDKILEIIRKLEEKGFAYESGGNVYFDTAKYGDYGKLSGLGRQEMIELSLERGADPKDPNKKDPLDFILWQKMAEGEPFWDSKWGKGRPGWHIECSAMINEHLGERIDIHGGGGDLIFPHHESEIAQSQAFTGKIPFAKVFMHTAMLRYQGEKMSKSLGNLVMVSDLVKTVEPGVVRWLLLSNHYRSEWEYTEKKLYTAKEQYNEVMRFISEFKNSETGDKNQFVEIPELEEDMDTPRLLTKTLEMTKDPGNLAYVKKILTILGFEE